VHRIAPVDPAEHLSQLGGADSHDPVRRRRPDEAAPIQPFDIKQHADAVVPKHFDQVTAFDSEHLRVTGMQIAPQFL
jgi:hypothetical protein